jgi:hypothetical protein
MAIEGFSAASKIRKDGSYGVPSVFIEVLAVKLTNEYFVGSRALSVLAN